MAAVSASGWAAPTKPPTATVAPSRMAATASHAATHRGRLIPSSAVPAAVDVDGLTGDVGGEVAAEPQDRVCDLFGLGPASHGDLLEHLLPRRLGNRFEHGRLREARRDRVDRNVPPRQLLRERAR